MKKQILYFGRSNTLTIIRDSLGIASDKELHQLKTLETELQQYLNQSSYTILVIDITICSKRQIALIKQTEEKNPNLFIILITDRKSLPETTEAMKSWVDDYIVKPFIPEEIQAVIDRNIERQQIYIENLQLKSKIVPVEKFKEIVTDDPKMNEIFQIILMVAQNNTPVLIEGETGTGKELVARAIHRESSRHSTGKFVAVNSGALPESLLESELFGHEKGSFTGAVKQRIGKIEAAHNGTLFLDEVGNISHNMQIKLLRVLQEKEFERVGGNKTISVDTRIIAASNRNLSNLVKQGVIREDFYYRINVMEIELPPLRERRADIPLLALYFLRKYREVMHKDIKSISQEAMNFLINHHWPGNIRELANVIERAVIMTHGPILSIKELKGLSIPVSATSGEDSELRIKIDENMPLNVLFDDITKTVEKEYLSRLLSACKGRLKHCAEKSGLSTRSIYTKMKLYGLDKKPFKTKKQNSSFSE